MNERRNELTMQERFHDVKDFWLKQSPSRRKELLQVPVKKLLQGVAAWLLLLSWLLITSLLSECCPVLHLLRTHIIAALGSILGKGEDGDPKRELRALAMQILPKSTAAQPRRSWSMA
jgi:hypothetical protein